MPSLRYLNILIIAVLRSLCTSAKLNFLGSNAIWLLAPGGGILSWVFTFVLWCLDLDIWSSDVLSAVFCGIAIWCLPGVILLASLPALDLRPVW